MGLWRGLKGEHRGGGGVQKGGVIRFGFYSIQTGRNGSLESDLCGMAQDRIDLGVMKETNITSNIYTREFAGYWMVALDVTRGHHVGVALFYQELQHFSVETY